MAKSFTNINTNFNDPLDVITSDKKPAVATETAPKTEPKEKSSNSGELKQKKEKREPKKDSLKITVKERQEAKTKRASIILKESTYKKIEGYSKKYNCSFNDLINQILEKVEL